MTDKPDFKKVLDQFPTRVNLTFARYVPGEPDRVEGSVHLAIDDPLPKEVVVGIQFSEQGFGFGEVVIKQTPEGVFLDTECMFLDRVKRYFNALLDSAVTDNDMDPVRHASYNRVMGRSCGEGCTACYPPTEAE
jgi:hypothetical protein